MKNEGLLYRGTWIAEVNRIIGEFSKPSDIDKLVNFLRTQHYPSMTSGQVPLLLSDKVFEGYMLLANQGHLLTPTNMSSAFWHHWLYEEGYFGTTDNLRARLTTRLINQDCDRLRLAKHFINPESVIAFEVEGELHANDDKIDGHHTSRYALYLSTPDLHTALKEAKKGRLKLRQHMTKLIDQAAHMYYGWELIYTQPILWLNSERRNYDLIASQVRENRERFERSILKAKEVERQAITHPFKGGLPGLGENSH